ncbi:MAG: radical SAM protein [Desulfovibrio sp.]|nr:MAG: radical SAM protein [Desulfovibrio sp.]
MEPVPVLLPQVFCAEKEGKWLLLNPEIPDWIVVNTNAALILASLSHFHTVEDIARQHSIAEENVAALLELAKQHSILEGSPPTRDATLRNAASSFLKSVHWKLTNACNLHCKYCYAESGKATLTPQLGDLKQVAHDIQSFSPNASHTLSGGEPLLHPHALEFGEHLRQQGCHVSLLTNGTLITRHNFRQIASIFPYVKISLDGSSEDIHAMTRGQGNHATVMKAVDMLLEQDCDVAIAMTVHKHNQQDIAAMSERYGNRLVFQPFFNAGRGSLNNGLMLTGDEYYQALACHEHISPLSRIEHTLNSLRGKGASRCSMAKHDISISETFDVYPCQLLTDKKFCAGNALETPVRTLLEHSDRFAKLRAINVDSIPKCSSCPIRYLCSGGCMARNYSQTGRVDVCGDFCEYEQQAIMAALFSCSMEDITISESS